MSSSFFPSLIPVPMPIFTPRLCIRPPQPGDGPLFYEAITQSQAHLAATMPWAKEHTSPEFSEDWARQAYCKFILRQDLSLGIFDSQQTRVIGGTGFHRIDWQVPCLEIGYWLRSDAEGQGYVSEAVNALVRYAFQQLKAKRLEIRCDADNKRSLLVAQRLGFQREALFRQHALNLYDQKIRDTLVYARYDKKGLPDLSVQW